MKIAMLGTGMVGQALMRKLLELGHEVTMGSREATHPGAHDFIAALPPALRSHASQGSFAQACEGATLVFNATRGDVSMAALRSAGAAALAGKVLVDVANPLAMREGGLPELSVSNTDSLGEQIQREFPAARVVKTLNTMHCGLMVNPGALADPGDVFVSGNDAAAKAEVVALLQSFGWRAPIDLGDIGTARGTEQWLPLWLRAWRVLGTPTFNLKLVR